MEVWFTNVRCVILPGDGFLLLLGGLKTTQVFVEIMATRIQMSIHFQSQVFRTSASGFWKSEKMKNICIKFDWISWLNFILTPVN